MLEFTKIAYFITVPVLLLISLAAVPNWRKYSIRLLAVTNLLLIGNSIFVVQQLVAVYRLGRSLGIRNNYSNDGDYLFFMRLVLIVVLPFFSLHHFFRSSRWFSAAMLVFLYTFYPLHTWNDYGLSYKIMTYLCLLCAAYALLWLWKKFPYQSP